MATSRNPGLFGAIFSRGAAAEAVSDAAWLEAMLRAEAVLAHAAAGTGQVSSESAAAVATASAPENFDFGKVAASAAHLGNPVAGIVDRLKELVPTEHHEAVHFFATSQDILDTAMMSVARDAVAAIRVDLAECGIAAIELSGEREPDPTMWGRTLLQQAKPIKFSDLALMWMRTLEAAGDSLRLLKFPASLSGPVGTYLSNRAVPKSDFGGKFAAELGLDRSGSWHTMRHTVVRIGSAAAEAAGACAKVAVDIILLSQNEIGEVSEGAPGGSTSMPHKRNPVAATCARACAARTPGLVSTLYAAMPQELQRSPGLWHSEWETLSDLLRLAGSAAAWLRESLEGLNIHPEAMERNLREAE